VDLYVGLVDKETKLRYILRHRAMPSVMDSQDITNGGLPANELDWGVLATERSMHRVASVLLGEVDKFRANDYKLRVLYVKEVVSCLAGERIWMIPKSDIQQWLIERVAVVQ
jgi:hypothetical protein